MWFSKAHRNLRQRAQRIFNFILTSLDNQNCFACIEKSLLPKISKEKFDYGLQGANKPSSVLILEHTANQLPQRRPKQFSLNYPLNTGNCVQKSPRHKNILGTTLTKKTRVLL